MTFALVAILALLASVPAFADSVADCPAPKGSNFTDNQVGINLVLYSYVYPDSARAAAADVNGDGYVCVAIRESDNTVLAFFDNTKRGGRP